MNQRKFAFSFALLAAQLVATPAVGQLLNHPVYALPQGPDAGATILAAQYARGLNDESFKDNSFAVSVLRAMERVTFAASGGYVLDYALGTESQLSLAGRVAVHLLSDDSTPVQVSVQGGFGWASVDGTPDNTSLTSFPIGVAISGRPSDSDTSVRPWVMPRLNIARVSVGGLIVSESDIGAPVGVGFTSESGAGAHMAVDWLNVEGGSPFGFSLGVHYVMGR